MSATSQDRPVAVVTGASTGIGAATARRLAAAGCRVVCTARRTDRIEALAAEVDGVAVTADVTDVDDVAALAEAAGPRVALLVNNAGVGIAAAWMGPEWLEQGLEPQPLSTWDAYDWGQAAVALLALGWAGQRLFDLGRPEAYLQALDTET